MRFYKFTSVENGVREQRVDLDAIEAYLIYDEVMDPTFDGEDPTKYTVIVLSNNNKYLVKETPDEIDQILEDYSYNQKLGIENRDDF